MPAVDCIGDVGCDTTDDDAERCDLGGIGGGAGSCSLPSPLPPVLAPRPSLAPIGKVAALLRPGVSRMHGVYFVHRIIGRGTAGEVLIKMVGRQISPKTGGQASLCKRLQAVEQVR